MNLPFFIAKRYIIPRKGAFSAFIIRLSVVATALSVATMIVAMAIVSGFKYEVKEKLYNFWGHVHISPFTPNSGSIITPEPIGRSMVPERTVKMVTHVEQLTPFVVRPVIIQGNNLMEGIQLKGVDQEYVFPRSISLEGKPINYSDTDYARQVLLSQTTADRMDLKAGDDIRLYFMDPNSGIPRVRKVQVTGIFRTGMDEVDRNYGICDIRMLQRINNWNPDDINGYQITLDDPDYADSVSDEIFSAYIQPPLTTYTINELFPNIIDWLQLQDVNTTVIIAIMSAVAIINLLVMLLILIVEHARMVGVLKTLGMGLPKMRRIFLYHSILIAGLGILLGTLLGVGLCYLQLKTGFIQLPEDTYYVKYAPVKLVWWHVATIDIATLLLCVLCMWLPTLYIRRIRPAKVLQFK